MNNEKAVVNSDEIITSFGNKIKSVDEQFNTIQNNHLNISVKDFGAKGDGATDDTTSIQNAINFLLNNSNYGTLYFPAGTYTITKQLSMYKNGVYYNIEGDGRRRSKIKANANMESMFKLGLNNETYVNYKISDLMFDLSTFANIGIDASYVVYSTIENCSFSTNKDNSKMLVISSWCNRVLNNLFTGSYDYIGSINGLDWVVGTAIHCPSNLSTNNLVIENNVIQKIENAIVLDDYVNDVHIHKNTFDGVGRILISVKGLKNGTFHYNYCERCGGSNTTQYNLNHVVYKDGNYTRYLLSPIIITEDTIMGTQFKTSLSIKYNQFANCSKENLVSVSLPRLFEFTNNDIYDYSTYSYDNIVNVIGKGIYNDCIFRVENNNSQTKNMVKWDINIGAYYTNRGDIAIRDFRKTMTFNTRLKSQPVSDLQNVIVNTEKTLREFSLGELDYKNPFKIVVDFERKTGTILKWDLYSGSNALQFELESNTATTSQTICFANEMQQLPYKDFRLFLYSDGELKINSVKLITSNKYNRVIDLLK